MKKIALKVIQQLGMTVFPPKKGIILTYHSICSEPSLISIHPELFRWQMQYLKKTGRKGVSLSEFISSWNISPRNASNLVALTFDDGYRDFYEFALPVIRQNNFSATVYIVTGMVGGRSLWPRIKSIPESNLMDWKQIKECRTNGIEIGSHTVDHVDLSGLNRATVGKQLLKSKFALEDKLSAEVGGFCYPYGKYNTLVIDEVKKAKYAEAVTLLFNYPKHKMNNYKLPRLGMNRIDPTNMDVQKLFFKTALAGTITLYSVLRNMIKRCQQSG